MGNFVFVSTTSTWMLLLILLVTNNIDYSISLVVSSKTMEAKTICTCDMNTSPVADDECNKKLLPLSSSSPSSLSKALKYLALPNDEKIAYQYFEGNGKGPSILFCNGFQSLMTNTKSTALEKYCRDSGRSFVRFDYRGHGSSSGNLVDMTIGDWIQDTITVLDNTLLINLQGQEHEQEQEQQPQILIVGSSMGVWIAIHVALARLPNIVGIVGVASAPDFTIDILDELPPSMKENITKKEENECIYLRPSLYSNDPYPFSYNLIKESLQWLLITDDNYKDKYQTNDIEKNQNEKDSNDNSKSTIPITCPVRFIHGRKDTDSHYSKSLALADALQSQDVIVTLIKNGDHRLSTPSDIDRLILTIEELSMVAGEYAN